ncbi:MAG TPA: hypothetical protein V6C85_34945 [Allocoleopsis sp.]
MKIHFSKLISFLGIIAALLVFCGIQVYSDTTAAQPSFIGNLPAGYTAYSATLAMGKSCSCALGGISGSPPPPPPCGTVRCVGSSNTRYGWIKTTAPGINSTFCDEKRQTTGNSIPPCFMLDGDDALVISGSMSPVQNISYYSFTFYQTYIYNSDSSSNYTLVRSSVNLGFNNSNLKQGSNGKYVLIAAANTQTINVVKQALRGAGVPDAIMNTYLVPASVTNLGNVDYPDQLSLALRLTGQSEAERQQVDTFAQQTAPATTVLFIKGPGLNGDVTFADLPKWEDTLRVNPVEYTTGLDQNLKELESTVIRRYNRQGYKLKARLSESLLHLDPDVCRANLESCVYDAPDALYTSFPCDFSPSPIRSGNCQIELTPNSNDVLMWIGVNHSIVGDKTLAAYWSGESQGFQGGNDGTFAFVGLNTQGSANQYLSRIQAANLYAIKITRSCGNDLYCASVPFIGRISNNKTGFILIGRTYLDKATGSGPNPANLIPATVLWFTRS